MLPSHPIDRNWDPGILRVLLISVMVFAATARGLAQDVGIGLIVVATEAEASAIRAELDSGAAFHVLAEARSIDSSRIAGGDLGPISIGELRPEFRELVAGIAPGEVRGPVAIDEGYALVRQHTVPEQRWLDAMASALSARDASQYLQAIEGFEDATAIAREFESPDPRLGSSLTESAAMWRLVGDFARGATLYLESLEIFERVWGPEHPSTLAVLSELADVNLALGKFSAAASAFERLLAIRENRLGPDHSDVAATLNSLGLARHLEGNDSEATPLFQRAVDIWERELGPAHPNVASAYFNLGVAAAGDRPADAESFIRQSLGIVEEQLGPDHPEVARHLVALAELRGVQNEWTEAAELYTESMGIRWGLDRESGPEVVEILDRLVELLSLRFGPPENGENRWNGFLDSMTVAPVNEEFFLATSAMLRAEGFRERGESVLGLGRERFPGSRRIAYAFADLLADAGRVGDALEGFRAALDRDGNRPESHSILVRLGDLLVEIGRIEPAREAYQQALGIEPNDAAARIGLGTLLVRTNETGLARSYFEEAVRLAPGNSLAHSRTSEVYLDLGMWTEADAAATRALESGSEDRRVRYVRAQARIAMGQDEASREDLAEYATLESRERRENEELLELSRVEREIHNMLGAGRVEAALERTRLARESYPDAYRLELTEGLVLGQLERYDEASEVLQSMIDRGIGDDAVIRKALAGFDLARGDTLSAVRNRALYLDRAGTELLAANTP